jgi:hypothetical protein
MSEGKQVQNEVAANKINMDSGMDSLIGKYIVLWRKEEKQACRVEKVDVESKFIFYELISGSDKGKKFKSRFDASQKGIDVYDDDSVILAVLSA